MNAEYLNLGIDFGAVAIFALLTKWDFDQGDELNAKVEEKMKQKKDNKVIRKAMKEREVTLSKLELEIRTSDKGDTQRAAVEAVQSGGKQHIIVVVGPRKAIRDALLGANILKMEFAMRDVLIVPYELGKKKINEVEEKLRPDGSGFGGGGVKPTWEQEPYVAQPVGEGWDEYIKAELDDAVRQNGEKVKNDGIAIVVSNSGEIIRRGVGQVSSIVQREEVIGMGWIDGLIMYMDSWTGTALSYCIQYIIHNTCTFYYIVLILCFNSFSQQTHRFLGETWWTSSGMLPRRTT